VNAMFLVQIPWLKWGGGGREVIDLLQIDRSQNLEELRYQPSRRVATILCLLFVITVAGHCVSNTDFLRCGV
jgi:hypothetical protein